ncbi:chemotaxis protein CheW [Rhodovulum sp. DZ06]|uniref:chemotaxis protein CheW n=1 Tax=Rhodovulum sp. DZ06 TaxID=3425126 RepID=UPI003D3560CA
MTGTTETRPGGDEPTGAQVVTMLIGDQLFAIDAMRVREIIDPAGVTRVPTADPFCEGLINVRGAVAPLVDFRVPFRMERRPAGPDARIVVLDLRVGSEDLSVGLLADKVLDVAVIDDARVDPPPDVGSRWPPHCVRGIGRHEGAFVVLPHLENIFASSAHGGVQGAAQHS